MNRGINFGASDKKLGADPTIWYPAAGFLSHLNGEPSGAFNDGIYWSNVMGEAFDFSTSQVYPSRQFCSATGASVRCVKEGSVPAPPVNLSADGRANCYIVSSPGKYRFNGAYKGNSAAMITARASADVLWETFGTKTYPRVGDVIKPAFLIGEDVFFDTPETLANGNAVIAVRDGSGKILWSWHIWVCAGYDPAATAQTYRNGVGAYLDRNIGATSATPGDVGALGVVYEWGRKDPFLNIPTIVDEDGTIRASSTISWPSPVSVGSFTFETGTESLIFSIENPTTYIGGLNDWYNNTPGQGGDNLWSTYEKSRYDPCPPGWRVPDGGPSRGWAKAFGVDEVWNSASYWDDTHKGYNFGTTPNKLGTSSVIWYPASGCGTCTQGWVCDVGRIGCYLSSRVDGKYVHVLNFGKSSVDAIWHSDRTSAGAVRCMAE